MLRKQRSRGNVRESEHVVHWDRTDRMTRKRQRWYRVDVVTVQWHIAFCTGGTRVCTHRRRRRYSVSYLVGEKKCGISRARTNNKDEKKKNVPKSRDIFRQTRNRVTNSMPVIHEARRHANGMRASRWRWIKRADQSAIVPAPARGSPCERCHVTSRFKSKARAERGGETSNRHHHHLRRFAPTDMARDVTTSWLRSTNGAPVSRVHIPRLPVASYSIFMWISVQICPICRQVVTLPPCLNSCFLRDIFFFFENTNFSI